MLIDRKNQTFRLGGVPVDNVSMQDAVSWVCEPSPLRGRVGVFVNAESYNQLRKNPALTTAISTADRVFADGIGVRLAAARLGIHLRDNVNGTDMLPILAAKAAKQGKSIYLLGGRPGVAAQARLKLMTRFPHLKVVGAEHGYFSADQTQEVINRVNAQKPDILLVGFGTPLQETWLKEHRNQLDIGVGLAVGGLLDFASGRIPRAPLWLRRINSEWIYRLIQEPKRMWRRYLLGNFTFSYFHILRRSY